MNAKPRLKVTICSQPCLVTCALAGWQQVWAQGSTLIDAAERAYWHFVEINRGVPNTRALAVDCFSEDFNG